jgi:hypothetical protein
MERRSDMTLTSGSIPMETTKQSKFDYHGGDFQFIDHVACVVIVNISKQNTVFVIGLNLQSMLHVSD